MRTFRRRSTGASVAIAGATVFVLAVAARAQLLTGPNPADDPNFPGLTGHDAVTGFDGPLSWGKQKPRPLNWQQAGKPDFTTNIPTVMLPLHNGTPAVPADYLGFVDGVGAFLQGLANTGIYVYSGSTHTLTRRYDKSDDIPPDILKALKNRKYIYISSHDSLNARGDDGAATAHVAVKPMEADPNLAGAAQDNYPLTWQGNGESVAIKSPQSPPTPAMYLGFNERGSWVASAGGTVFVWNLAGKTLTEAAGSWWEVPLDLRNPSALLQAVIYYREHQYKASAGRSQAPDPNFPPTMAEFSRAFLSMIWTYQTAGTDPLVYLSAGEPDRYLGFDERGAWVLGKYGGIFVWSFKTWKIERVASRIGDIPKEALMRLHHPDSMVTQAITGR
jgi:hypothetical protein